MLVISRKIPSDLPNKISRSAKFKACSAVSLIDHTEVECIKTHSRGIVAFRHTIRNISG